MWGMLPSVCAAGNGDRLAFSIRCNGIQAFEAAWLRYDSKNEEAFEEGSCDACFTHNVPGRRCMRIWKYRRLETRELI